MLRSGQIEIQYAANVSLMADSSIYRASRGNGSYSFFSDKVRIRRFCEESVIGIIEVE